jgi:hypothetical protein
MFIFRKQFYFIVSCLKIIGHGNPDSNLESLCIITITSTGISTAATAVNGRRAIVKITTSTLLFGAEMAGCSVLRNDSCLSSPVDTYA